MKPTEYCKIREGSYKPGQQPSWLSASRTGHSAGLGPLVPLPCSGRRRGYGILILVWAVLALCALSQNELLAQNCEESENRKALKWLDKAKDGSHSNREKLDFAERSLQADPDCIQCLMLRARLLYRIANEERSSLDPALNSFVQVASACPGYHADAHYFAGLIQYVNESYREAVEHFEAFLLFDTEAGKRSRDHAAKEKDVARLLPEIRFYVDFYDNPVPYNPVRLDKVNSAADEYLPMLSPDNAFLFFTRKEKIKEKGSVYSREVETFMKSRREGGNLDYDHPEPLPPPFNVGDNYGGVSISLDNREMFVTVCKPAASGYNNCDIYMTHFDRKKDESGAVVFEWSGLQNLGPNVNTPDGWEAQPSISADGKVLYFASVRAGSTPDKDGNPSIDIYSSERMPDGDWSPAEPLNVQINTPGNDKSPFLHSDSRTLYFSSNGRPGAGGYDIYYSRQDSAGNWTTPRNLGYPINSNKDEHGLVVSTDGRTALFASANPAGSRSLDIYAFDLPQKARPEKVLILKGNALDGNGEALQDARIELKYARSEQTRDFSVDEEDGHYAAVVNLREDEEVLVSVKSKSTDIAFNSRVYTLADTLKSVRELDLKLERIEPGKTYRVNDIRFATASSIIDAASRKVLKEFASYLLENPGLHIEVLGHTDNVGDPYKNLVLSTDRAFEVFGYLQEEGVEPSRLSFKGYGETKPIVPNDSPENQALNRRTEFRVLRK